MALIRRYDFRRAFSSRAVPIVARAWGAVSNYLCRYQRFQPKANRQLRVLFFTDEKHLDLVLESLWSIANSWRELPRLCVVADLGAREHVFRRALSWWAQEWDFVPYEEVETTFKREQRDWLVKFGRHHIFGRKLASILHSARIAPTLYSDSDVLWLGAPRFLNSIDLEEPRLLVSRDCYASYCEAMLTPSTLDILQPPFACAGLLYLSQWPWPEAALMEWVNRASSIPPHPFAEQTIFGLLARNYGGYIAEDEIASFFHDWFYFLPESFRPTWSARHYFGPVRHHFHRDALLMRCGILRSPETKITAEHSVACPTHRS